MSKRQRSCGVCAALKRSCSHQVPCEVCVSLGKPELCQILPDRRTMRNENTGARIPTAAYASQVIGTSIAEIVNSTRNEETVTPITTSVPAAPPSRPVTRKKRIKLISNDEDLPQVDNNPSGNPPQPSRNIIFPSAKHILHAVYESFHEDFDLIGCMPCFPHSSYFSQIDEVDEIFSKIYSPFSVRDQNRPVVDKYIFHKLTDASFRAAFDEGYDRFLCPFMAVYKDELHVMKNIPHPSIPNKRISEVHILPRVDSPFDKPLPFYDILPDGIVPETPSKVTPSSAPQESFDAAMVALTDAVSMFIKEAEAEGLPGEKVITGLANNILSNSTYTTYEEINGEIPSSRVPKGPENRAFGNSADRELSSSGIGGSGSSYSKLSVSNDVPTGIPMSNTVYHSAQQSGESQRTQARKMSPLEFCDTILTGTIVPDRSPSSSSEFSYSLSKGSSTDDSSSFSKAALSNGVESNLLTPSSIGSDNTIKTNVFNIAPTPSVTSSSDSTKPLSPSDSSSASYLSRIAHSVKPFILHENATYSHIAASTIPILHIVYEDVTYRSLLEANGKPIFLTVRSACMNSALAFVFGLSNVQSGILFHSVPLSNVSSNFVHPVDMVPHTLRVLKAVMSHASTLTDKVRIRICKGIASTDVIMHFEYYPSGSVKSIMYMLLNIELLGESISPRLLLSMNIVCPTLHILQTSDHEYILNFQEAPAMTAFKQDPAFLEFRKRMKMKTDSYSHLETLILEDQGPETSSSGRPLKRTVGGRMVDSSAPEAWRTEFEGILHAFLEKNYGPCPAYVYRGPCEALTFSYGFAKTTKSATDILFLPWLRSHRFVPNPNNDLPLLQIHSIMEAQQSGRPVNAAKKRGRKPHSLKNPSFNSSKPVAALGDLNRGHGADTVALSVKSTSASRASQDSDSFSSDVVDTPNQTNGEESTSSDSPLYWQESGAWSPSRPQRSYADAKIAERSRSRSTSDSFPFPVSFPSLLESEPPSSFFFPFPFSGDRIRENSLQSPDGDAQVNVNLTTEEIIQEIGIDVNFSEFMNNAAGTSGIPAVFRSTSL